MRGSAFVLALGMAAAAAGPLEAKSPIKFTEIGKKAGINDPALNGTGPMFADYDQDGDMDIFVSTEAIGPGIALRLWENLGRGSSPTTRFTDVAQARGLDLPGTLGRGAAWGDYDNDGDLDLVIATMPPNASGPLGQKQKHVPTTLMRNLLKETGKANFENVTVAAKLMRKDNAEDAKIGGIGNTGGGIGFIDYDNDGWLDIFHRNADGEVDNALFHSNGDGTFTDVTAESGIAMHDVVKESNSQGAPSWADFDNDGDMDPLVTNEGDFSVLFLNDGPKGSSTKFTNIMNSRRPPSGLAFRLAGNTQGSCLGDIDNDGDIDAYLPLADQANRLIRNDLDQGPGGSEGLTFTDITKDSGAGDRRGARSCVMADFDNDGLLDIYVNNGGPQNVLINDVIDGFPPFVRFYIAWEPDYNVLLRNVGGAKFEDVTKGSGAEGFGIGSGVGAGDINGDGFLDMFATNRTYYNGFKRANIAQESWLFLNKANKNNWIKVALVGTKSNRSGIGARVRVVSGDLAQIRERVPAHGYNSANEPLETFGLGARKAVDYIEVRWPSGLVQRVDKPGIKQIVRVVEAS
ncbi:MAG: CRTAC1 family protein [Rhodospirillaceae bacterium]|nr:CRTAC1 family protein [Rhodospirillaceae bacterium]